MINKFRMAATSATFLFIIFGLFIANFFYKPPKYSANERRKLAAYKSPTFSTIKNKQFMIYFDEKYSLDSFFLRDGFRSVKANMSFNILRQLDNNGIYIVQGHASKLDNKLNENSIRQAAQKINQLQGFFPAKQTKIYYSVIPDKNYYLASKNGYPSVDYNSMMNIMHSTITNATYIDLFSVLSINDYYYTDLHWNQRKLWNAVNKFGSVMNFNVDMEADINIMQPFYGVYYGQSALSLHPELMIYMTNTTINNCIVKLIDTKTLQMTDSTMYNIPGFNDIDQYNLFLYGAQPLITIENLYTKNDRELYLFRDSFGSSLAPLLVAGYKKITLIDLRYIASSLADKLIDWNPNSDVLFLYNTSLLNNSATLLVQ